MENKSHTEEKYRKTRLALLGKKMGFNQMRNAIYILQRYMHINNISDAEIRLRLREMGKNIGASIFHVISDAKKNQVTLSSDENLSKEGYIPLDFNRETPPEDIIKGLYSVVLGSNVKIEIEDDCVHVFDTKDPLSKYQYPDLSISGSELTIGMISKFIELSGFSIGTAEVIQCKSMGNSLSEHIYCISHDNNTPKGGGIL